MTKATAEGRQLMLTVEGVDAPFVVDPLPAKRGRALTERFLAITLGETVGNPERIFAEALGAANYARISGDDVRVWDASGSYVHTLHPDGVTEIDQEVGAREDGERFEIVPSEQDAPVAIRQEEADALALCAFYWQTVVGMEAVAAFLESGEGSEGSLKALRLLLTRTALSSKMTSSSTGTGSGMQGAHSIADPATANSSANGPSNVPAAVRLPPHKRSIRQNVKSAFHR